MASYVGEIASVDEEMASYIRETAERRATGKISKAGYGKMPDGVFPKHKK